MKKRIQWDQDKNRKLKEERGISFDEILACIENGKILDIREHTAVKYDQEMLFIIELEGYVYYVPFVEDEQGIFLKTIIPSRKMTKEYLKGK
ncbi:MAG: BrnT family toxin [Candidatus Omnitrophota bacterium]